jgi:hypothetical protein
MRVRVRLFSVVVIVVVVAVWFRGAIIMVHVRARSLFVSSDVVIVVVAVVEVVGKEEAKKVRRGCSATFQVNDFGGP